ARSARALLSLPDALPICPPRRCTRGRPASSPSACRARWRRPAVRLRRSPWCPFLSAPSSSSSCCPSALLQAYRRGDGQQLDEDRSEEHTSELQSPDHLVC